MYWQPLPQAKIKKARVLAVRELLLALKPVDSAREH